MIRRVFQSIGLSTNDVAATPCRDHRLELGEIESLESREMLAGDVELSVSSSGNVRIVGDDAANQIGIFRTPTNLLMVAGNSGTTVTYNGNSSNFHFVDALDSDGAIRGNLTIDLNEGSDLISLDGVDVRGNLRVQLDQGADILDYRNSVVYKNATILAGNGFDGDFVEMESTAVAGNLKVNLGAGSSDRNDYASLNGVGVGRNLSIVGSSNRQTVIARNFLVDGNTRVSTGDGSDNIELRNAELNRNLSMVAGSGDDQVNVQDLRVAGNSRFSLGSGIDQLQQITASTFNGSVRFIGGSGSDNLVLNGDSVYNRAEPKISQFESAFTIFP